MLYHMLKSEEKKVATKFQDCSWYSALMLLTIPPFSADLAAKKDFCAGGGAERVAEGGKMLSLIHI